MRRGGDRSKPPIGGLVPDVSVADAADKMKVSKRTVERAKAVEKQDPALLDEIIAGGTKLADATKKAGAAQPDGTVLHEVADTERPGTKSSIQDAVKHRAAANVFETITVDQAVRAACDRYGFKSVIGALVDVYGYDDVSDEVLEHNP
jgi:hypothetical protein